MLGQDLFATLEGSFPQVGIKRVIVGEPGSVAILPGSGTGEEDEPEIAPSVTEEDLAGATAIVFAGDADNSKAAYAKVTAANAPALCIDASGHLEGLAPNRMRAPDFEPRRGALDLLQSLPDPAAYWVMRLLGLLHEQTPVQKSVAQIFLPASAWGKSAVEELHQQTIALFNFKQQPKKVFAAEATFQLLPRFGEEAKVSLAAAEQMLEKHLASLAAILSQEGAPMLAPPSFQVLHAPVLHGTTLSLWVQFAKLPDAEALERHLREEGIDVRDADMEPASNRAVAGMDGVTMESLRRDRNDSRALWLFLAADNHRTSATLAADVLREVL